MTPFGGDPRRARAAWSRTRPSRTSRSWTRACGRLPAHLFDTQVAAGFIGLGSPSLASLVERLLDVRLTKGDRLTDWTRRPLHVEQRVYAAADVEHLLALHDILVARLEPMGRLELGDRRVRGAAPARPHAPGARRRLVAHEGRAPAARQAPRRRPAGRGLAGTHRGQPRRPAPLRAVRPRAHRRRAADRPATARSSPAIRGVDGRSLRDGTTDDAARRGRGRPRARPVDRSPARVRPHRPLARARRDRDRRVARAAGVRARPRSRGPRDPRRSHAAPARRAEPPRVPAGAPTSSAHRSNVCSRARRRSCCATADAGSNSAISSLPT